MEKKVQEILQGQLPEGKPSENNPENSGSSDIGNAPESGEPGEIGGNPEVGGNPDAGIRPELGGPSDRTGTTPADGNPEADGTSPSNTGGGSGSADGNASASPSPSESEEEGGFSSAPSTNLDREIPKENVTSWSNGRSEERRVGKEWRSRWPAHHEHTERMERTDVVTRL